MFSIFNQITGYCKLFTGPIHTNFFLWNELSVSKTPLFTWDRFQKWFHPHGNTENDSKRCFYSPRPLGGANHGALDMRIKSPHWKEEWWTRILVEWWQSLFSFPCQKTPRQRGLDVWLIWCFLKRSVLAVHINKQGRNFTVELVSIWTWGTNG